MISLNGTKIEPTIFPDKTSQVWKITAPRAAEVTWEFEHEGELMHLAQLAALLSGPKTLHMPFLPYGRQDKEVSNESTFALRTFANLINTMGFRHITTIDAHSSVFLELTGAKSLSPKTLIYRAIEDTKATVVGLPDHGASLRYTFKDCPIIVGQKERDQTSGHLKYSGAAGCDVSGKTVLIVDDICDGGMTFILFADILKGLGADDIHLWTTHGIYSKGIEVLKRAGISRVFNRKGEVK